MDRTESRSAAAGESSARSATQAFVSNEEVAGAGSGVNGIDGSCEQPGPWQGAFGVWFPEPDNGITGSELPGALSIITWLPHSARTVWGETITATASSTKPPVQQVSDDRESDRICLLSHIQP